MSDEPWSGSREWVRRQPVAAFHVALFVLGVPLMSLPILAHHGVLPGGTLPARLGLDTERFVVLVMMYGVMLPGALWVTWTADGASGLTALLRRAVAWRFAHGWWIAVLFGLPMLTLGLALLMGDALTPLTVSMVGSELVSLAVGFFVVNLWEETVWAGVVQGRLARRHGMLIGALLTAVPFTLIHVPLQFIGDVSWRPILVNVAALLVFAAVFRLLIAAFLLGTGGSVLAVGLLHAVLNRSNNPDGIVARVLEGDAQPVAVLVATLLLTAGAGLTVRSRLSSDRLAPEQLSIDGDDHGARGHEQGTQGGGE